jgi:hypothetical protein
MKNRDRYLIAAVIGATFGLLGVGIGTLCAWLLNRLLKKN